MCLKLEFRIFWVCRSAHLGLLCRGVLRGSTGSNFSRICGSRCAGIARLLRVSASVFKLHFTIGFLHIFPCFYLHRVLVFTTLTHRRDSQIVLSFAAAGIAIAQTVCQIACQHFFRDTSNCYHVAKCRGHFRIQWLRDIVQCNVLHCMCHWEHQCKFSRSVQPDNARRSKHQHASSSVPVSTPSQEQPRLMTHW